MTKNQVAIILAILGLLGAAGGGSLYLDNSTTTNTDNSQNTVINNLIDEDAIIERGLDIICASQPDLEVCK